MYILAVLDFARTKVQLWVYAFKRTFHKTNESNWMHLRRLFQKMFFKMYVITKLKIFEMTMK